VEGAVDLEHEQPAVGESPLAVGEAHAARPLAPAYLPERSRKAEPAADAADVDLGHRLGAALDVGQGGAEQAGPPQRLEPVDPATEAGRRGEALLDDGGQQPAPLRGRTVRIPRPGAPGVQQPEPDALHERERPGRRADDRRRAEGPPLRLDLVPHVVVVEPERVQLSARQHPVLPGGEGSPVIGPHDPRLG
jgi:hypothetical protein